MSGWPLFGAALLLPWVAGASLVRLTQRRAGPGSGALMLGYGYPLGMLLVIALVLAFDAAGLLLSAASLGAAFALLTAALALAAARRATAAPLPATAPAREGRVALALAVLFWLLVALRLGTLAAELLSRPLFAWDAWMNWAPRAVVWFHEQRLVPFAPPDAWLAAPPDSGVYTLGNSAASDYPPGVPIIMLWHMLALGSSVSAFAFLPWVLLPLSLALALWGHLRRRGTGRAVAAGAAFALVSLPFLDVHAALAGYADLWLAACFGLAALALGTWLGDGDHGCLLLALLLALAAALMKKPGAAFAGIVLALAAARYLHWSTRRWAGVLLGAAALAALALALGFTLPLPGGADLAFEGGVLTLPYLGELELAVHPLPPILAQGLFLAANWHLLWLAVALALVAGTIRRRSGLLADPVFQALASGALLLYCVFGFTDYFRQAENGVTLSRTLLYLTVPAVAFAARELDGWLRLPVGERAPRTP